MCRSIRSDGRQTIASGTQALLSVSLLLAALAVVVAANPVVGMEGSGRSPEQPEPSVLGIVVVLADTADAPGQSTLSHFQGLGADVNRYYALNAYGCVSFDFTFQDADGPSAAHDWYTLGPSLSAYSDGYTFAAAAMAKAFAGVKLPESAYLERAIVVYAGASQQSDETRPFCSSTLSLSGERYIEVQGPRHVTRLYLANLVLISEQDGLGVWVHELAHTLSAGYAADGAKHIADRYDSQGGQQGFGRMGYWDLMGFGCRWGQPTSSAPTHMSSYTKVAAGWLHYAEAPCGKDIVLTALENQTLDDDVLTLDDPLSDDPLSYYIIEARDGEGPFGAPESGVVIYHVSYDHTAGHATVNPLPRQHGLGMSYAGGRAFQRSTLHGLADPEGAREYLNATAGFRVTLVAESFQPYKATVRIERYQAD